MTNLVEANASANGAKQEHHDGFTGGAFWGQGLGISIGPILGQYEKVLNERVEAMVKERTLEAAEEGSEILRHQIQERLLLVESEVQRGIEDAISRAREHMLERIREGMDTLLGELDTRLQDNVTRTSPLKSRLESPPQREEGESVHEPEVGGAYGEQQAASSSGDGEMCLGDVCLQIGPPVNLLSLISFYRRLWQTQEVNIIQALGSIDKGVTLELRLTEPSVVDKVLSDVRYVEDSEHNLSDATGNGRRTIRVFLPSPGAEGNS